MSMMKGFSNVFRIPELRKKIFITLGLVAVCRLVAFIPTPGVDWTALQEAIKPMEGTGKNVLDWFNTFTGGALEKCSIGTLSIWPYISASIVIQLLSALVPSLQKLKKEGENGRQQLAQITRYLTILLCVVQAWGISSLLCNPGRLGFNATLVEDPGLGFQVMTVICMTAASLFIMWIADQITSHGVGNGASLIIMINITSRLPAALWQAYDHYFVRNPGKVVELLLLVLFFIVVVMGTVMLTQGVRKVAIHSTRRSVGGGNTYGMKQTYMPLKVNYTGVMPIIFAQPLLQVLALALGWLAPNGSVAVFAEKLANNTSMVYISIYSVLIVFFTFFWVATQFNAIEISENLKKDGSYIPGVRPGRATAEFLDEMMTKITIIGAFGLLIIAIVPMLLMGKLGIEDALASFFGGTSLLIIVGVALDTLRILESHLLVRKYDGFLSHGRLRGRSGM